MGSVVLALQEQGRADAHVPTGPARIEFQRLAIRGLGLRTSVDLQQRAAEVAVGVRPQRIALEKEPKVSGDLKPEDLAYFCEEVASGTAITPSMRWSRRTASSSELAPEVRRATVSRQTPGTQKS